MKFEPAPANSNLFLRQVSNCGTYEMGILRVMYGYRIRCGRIGEASVVLDWCAGDLFPRISWLYGAMLACLDRVNPEKLPSHSDPKPFFNDPKFMKTLMSIASSEEMRKFMPVWSIDDLMAAERQHRELLLAATK